MRRKMEPKHVTAQYTFVHYKRFCLIIYTVLAICRIFASLCVKVLICQVFNFLDEPKTDFPVILSLIH